MIKTNPNGNHIKWHFIKIEISTFCHINNNLCLFVGKVCNIGLYIHIMKVTHYDFLLNHEEHAIFLEL